MDGIEMDDAARLAGAQKRLRQKMLALMPEDGDYGSILLHGFTATRRSKAEISTFVRQPVMGLVVQGTRQLQIGHETRCCQAGSCFVGGTRATTALSVAASVSAPYLSLSLDLDENLVRTYSNKEKCNMDAHNELLPTLAAFHADLPLSDAFYRLLMLIDNPEQFFYLGPLLVKEIHYRMIFDPLGRSFKKFNKIH